MQALKILSEVYELQDSNACLSNVTNFNVHTDREGYQSHKLALKLESFGDSEFWLLCLCVGFNVQI